MNSTILVNSKRYFSCKPSDLADVDSNSVEQPENSSNEYRNFTSEYPTIPEVPLNDREVKNPNQSLRSTQSEIEDTKRISREVRRDLFEFTRDLDRFTARKEAILEQRYPPHIIEQYKATVQNMQKEVDMVTVNQQEYDFYKNDE